MPIERFLKALHTNVQTKARKKFGCYFNFQEMSLECSLAFFRFLFISFWLCYWMWLISWLSRTCLSQKRPLSRSQLIAIKEMLQVNRPHAIEWTEFNRFSIICELHCSLIPIGKFQCPFDWCWLLACVYAHTCMRACVCMPAVRVVQCLSCSPFMAPEFWQFECCCVSVFLVSF